MKVCVAERGKRRESSEVILELVEKSCLVINVFSTKKKSAGGGDAFFFFSFDTV